MKKNVEDFFIAIDIGAGLGAKIGLFTDPHHQIGERLLRADEFGDGIDSLVDRMLDTLRDLLDGEGRGMEHARAIGIASPGLFASDGSYLLAANLPFLNNQNLRLRLEQATGIPTSIENDANAGGLAEWSVLRTDLLYWVFGGGWGGAWIANDGVVRYPALDWDRNDASLHFTNEPGYSIPLDKFTLKTLFYQFGVSYDRFERIAIEDLEPEGTKLSGPGGSPDHIRAEVILSGTGRCRLFRAVVGDDDFYERFLDIHETKQMTDPSIAGQFISKLSRMRVEAAVQTDRLFGHILAQATLIMIKQARADGLPDGVPICLGGKPSYALPYFGPSAQSRLGALGIMSYLRPSVIDERGFNANLVGAAVLAMKTHHSVGGAGEDALTEISGFFVIISPPITYRTIDTARDGALCAANHRDACIISFGEDAHYEGATAYLNWLRKRIEEFPDGHVLAYLGDAFIGQLELQVPYGLTVGYANLYYVTEKFRGKGYGRLMHDYAERYFRSWEANRIELHVSTTTLRAWGFYRKLGYQLVRVEGDKRRLWRMAKSLVN